MSQTSEMAKTKTGEVSWNELVTTDTKAAGGFYGKLFGWQTAPFEGGEPGSPPYTLFKPDPNSMGVAGMMQVPHPQMPAQWVPYVVVDNIDATLAKATKLGAKSLLPVTSIKEIGRICVIKDPQGATIGMHEYPK
jgi:predicted enzyme related to lactoylglutathione lyase